MRFRMEMGWTDEVVWRRQPMHQVTGWISFRNTMADARGLEGERPRTLEDIARG
jgi:hypothetical protein